MIGLCVMGSTGTIGDNTLDLVSQHPDEFRVVALGARRSVAKLLARSLARLPSLPPASGQRAAVRWVGETGPLLDAGAVAAQAAYLQALAAAAHQAAQQGDPGLQVPLLPGHEAASAHPRHALNWQRAVRQAEDEGLRAPR